MITKLSLKNVMRNKRRTLITLSVIVVGVSMLSLAMGYVRFSEWGYSESVIHSLTGHFQVTTRDLLNKEEEKVLAFGITDWEKTAARIAEDPRVEVVTPRISFMGLASTGEKSTAIMVQAVIPENEIRMGGNFISPDEYKKLQGKEMGVLLGPQLAKSLGIKEGGIVTVMTTTSDGALNAIDLNMEGTYTTGIEEMDKRFALINLPTARNLLGSQKVERLAVRLKNTAEMSAVMSEWKTKLEPALVLRNWKEVFPDFQKAMNFLYQMIGFVMPVLMIIVWFSTMNTILMSLMERSPEFATLRAMGTSKFRMFRMLVTEGAWIGLIGVGLGIAIEVGLAWLINHANVMMPAPPGQTHGYRLQVLNDGGIFWFTGTLTFLVVVLSTLIPARRIFRLNIVKALRNV